MEIEIENGTKVGIGCEVIIRIKGVIGIGRLPAMLMGPRWSLDEAGKAFGLKSMTLIEGGFFLRERKFMGVPLSE
ncbi:hypothetical protein EVAR_85005_1 [Eumeta japonica]|uniref:Uncharacterized protein n=1 Tax=Eumeta variegata TaxID=151549 RepID=A0A4C1W8Q6_EUMVA|nr:hypothetical protein EVAR_85005_1 [Eumeta japonica]